MLNERVGQQGLGHRVDQHLIQPTEKLTTCLSVELSMRTHQKLSDATSATTTAVLSASHDIVPTCSWLVRPAHGSSSSSDGGTDLTSTSTSTSTPSFISSSRMIALAERFLCQSASSRRFLCDLDMARDAKRRQTAEAEGAGPRSISQVLAQNLHLSTLFLSH